MKKIKVLFENCYGIGKLDFTFDFQNKKPYSIYAPNGFMKTSFAKSFKDLSFNQDSKDLIFPERPPIRKICDENNADIQPNEVYVIEPYKKDFDYEKTTSLLVNAKLKQQYDTAVLKIENIKDELIKKLKESSGLKTKTEQELLKCFNETSIFVLFEKIKGNDIALANTQLTKVSYAELFNDDAIGLLSSGAIATELQDYLDTYSDLISNSPILHKSFDHYRAQTVHKSLLENNFFGQDVKHSVNLHNSVTNSSELVTTAAELQSKLNEERDRVLASPELKQKFDVIDKKLLKNNGLRDFKAYLAEHQFLVAQLSDYKQLQKNIWVAYLAEHMTIFNELSNEYTTSKTVMETVIEEAKNEQTAWEAVVNSFNQKFNVPFKLSVENQQNVILNSSNPKISFTFEDELDNKPVNQNDLIGEAGVLSQGERRALHILNIMFEIESRIKLKGKTLLIVDDIADSFDYKNKYAIIEYLKEISETDGVFAIFLTHNFDFHRTISSRLDFTKHSDHQLIATRNGREITLETEKYQNNFFKGCWKLELHHAPYLIASIPFVRNLAEYCGFDKEYAELTEVLHIKTNTKNLTIQNIKDIFDNVLQDKPAINVADKSKLLFDLIQETAETILADTAHKVELEGKIVLSIAIRLKAEEFMIAKISNDAFVQKITGNQTQELFKEYKNSFSNEIKAIETIGLVNLMTPENIHVNSFMYEPILDMDSTKLKTLYSEVKLLT
jgi:ABC-type lipoprotein export system ATPase subunit